MLKFFILFITISYPRDIFVCDSLTKIPLGAVNVYTILNGTTTDSNGICQLNKFKVEDIITFSHIGYEKKLLLNSNIKDT